MWRMLDSFMDENAVFSVGTPRDHARTGFMDGRDANR